MAAGGGRFGLPGTYVQRGEPEYFVDVDDGGGVTWQPDVYVEVAALAERLGRGAVIDLGCGRAGKLVSLHVRHELAVIGVDTGDNIHWCRRHLSGVGRWLDVDLERATTLPVPATVIRDSIVVCSDVLEHLVDPRPAMRLIGWLLSIGAGGAVLSTPARDLRAGAGHMGPPLNPSHVREWTQEEFRAFVTGFPVMIQRAELTRSDDGGGGHTTQLVIVTDGDGPG